MNATAMVQLLLFILKVNGDFEIHEELTSINNLCERSVGENISKEVEKIQIQYDLKWNLLRCVTCDGGVNMYRVEKTTQLDKFRKFVKMQGV